MPLVAQICSSHLTLTEVGHDRDPGLTRSRTSAATGARLTVHLTAELLGWVAGVDHPAVCATWRPGSRPADGSPDLLDLRYLDPRLTPGGQARSIRAGQGWISRAAPGRAAAISTSRRFWRLPVRVAAEPAGEPVVSGRILWHRDLLADGLALATKLRLQHLPRPSQSVLGKLVIERDRGLAPP